MANDFRQYAQQLGPRGWLEDDTSQAYIGAHGAQVSVTLALWKETVKARFASTCPSDALDRVGEARQLERAPGEGDEDYRGTRRLQRCFEIHRQECTDDGYRNALEPLGVDPSLVYVWNDYEAGLGVWWSSVYVVVDMTGADPWSLDEWDDGAWDDGGVWDLNGLTDAGVHYMRRTIRRWKWAGAYPVAVWVWLSGDVWDDGGAWDDGGLWDDGGAGFAVPILLGHIWEEGSLLYGADELWDDGSTWEEAFPE